MSGSEGCPVDKTHHNTRSRKELQYSQSPIKTFSPTQISFYHANQPLSPTLSLSLSPPLSVSRTPPSPSLSLPLSLSLSLSLYLSVCFLSGCVPSDILCVCVCVCVCV